MDDTGQPTSGDQKAITMELITGSREELYWEKVPEKARQQAIKRLAAVENGASDALQIEQRKRRRMA